MLLLLLVRSSLVALSENSFREIAGLFRMAPRGRYSDTSFKKTFCLMNIRPQDLLSHEPTLWFRRHQLFWFRRTIFLRPQSPTKSLESAVWCMGERRSSWTKYRSLLEAILARIFFRFQISLCWIFLFLLIVLCACKAFVSNKSLASAPPNQAPVSGCRHSSCLLIIHVCLCVCLCMCVWKYVGKVININKYKQNRDDVTRNINIETEIDVHSDVT